MKIETTSHAKLNLSLEVLARRDDGYHDIRSLMIPIDKLDRITLITSEEGSIECRCGHPDVPDGPSNLAYRAAEVFMEVSGEQFGVEIDIEKHIPVGAGLGGGSGNAAAVLKELNSLRGSPLRHEELADLAAGLGSDVPFFLKDIPQWAEGRGEKLSEGPELPDWTYLVVFPGFKIGAGWAYNHLPLTFFSEKNTIGYISLEGVQLVNHLETSVRGEYPVVDELKERLLDLGARRALMTGSGPSVFGIYDNRKVADKAVRELSVLKNSTVFLARVLEPFRK